MKKLFALLGVIFLVSLMFVPLVSASYVCPAQRKGDGSELSYNSILSVQGVHPSATTARSATGQAFTANATCYLYNITVNLRKVNAPTGTFDMVIGGIQTGTVASGNAYPSSTVLISSTTVLNASDLSGTYNEYTFEFPGTFEFQSGTDYIWYLRGLESLLDTSNYVYVGYETALVGSGSAGHSVHYRSSGWYTDTTDLIYTINGDTSDSGATPTPTPAPSSGGSGDADIENLTAIILPWLIPLLVCLIPALLGYKFVGELGFFIGLNVGVILAYVTLAGTAYAFPLWGIILVGVMDVAVVLMRR